MPIPSPAQQSQDRTARGRPFFVVGQPVPPSVNRPAWLATLAVAEHVTPALVALVCDGSGEQPPRDMAAFLAGLAADGVLHRCVEDVAGEGLRLDADVRTALLADLESRPGGARRVRHDLIRLGVANAPDDLAGQLAIWAEENADWWALSALWLRYPAATWSDMGPGVVRAFSRIPSEARRAHPALSQAAALTAALDPARAGSLSEQASRELRQDGRLLHSGWATHPSLDAAVRAGSMWMFAQRTMDGHPDPLDDAWATREAIARLIDQQTLAGNAPSSSAQTLFHATSGVTALLRGDIFEARSNCEQAMLLARPGDPWALVAAAVVGLLWSIAGNPRGLERAAAWYLVQAPACGAFAELAAPYLHLAIAHSAVRLLDREQAEESLKSAAVLEESSEFWSAYAWVRSMHDLCWRKPEYGLARLEAAVNRKPSSGQYETLSDALAIRAQADLLACAGRIHEADALLKASAHSRLNQYLPVSEGRMLLCSHDAARALRVADDGVRNPEVRAHARAHLHVIRSAAMLLLGSDSTVVTDALHEACTLCTETADVLPFVFIPAHLRSGLLRLHDEFEHDTPCILDDAMVRHRLCGVWGNFAAAPTVIRLTSREAILLPLLATPETIEALARQLHVSVNTVRKQVATLRHKFDAPTRQAMIATARQLGMIA